MLIRRTLWKVTSKHSTDTGNSITLKRQDCEISLYINNRAHMSHLNIGDNISATFETITATEAEERNESVCIEEYA